MRFFTNKGVVQKTIIAIVIVILTTFSVPAPVQADWGGKLLSPIFLFFTAIADGFQHLLESALLGETSGFMKDIQSDDYNKASFVDLGGSGAPEGSVITDSSGNVWTNIEIDGSFFGIDAVNVPVINYTPEAIFQNQVPALDINFITPSIQGDDERNTAVQLRSTIASWYMALRSISVVGLLSVLVYLGIRMLLTSIAADRAKYKQMLVDWFVAICLVMVLHYIMAFALTMTETITAMFASEANGTITVSASNVNKHWWNSGQLAFSTNLMGFVRFMVQSEEIGTKIAYFVLYVILVVYSYRFTWVYLKRVVNMAFLTLIAPVVALTYPIDKVSDGKAQAFNLWIREYSYNALLQPIHLLLYKILLGSAIGLATKNPIYAIVCLGFIIAAEKLVKQMFNFGKANGGTVGSLAGAAGVSVVANKALQGFAKKGPGPQGKVRTKEGLERQGKDANANKPFAAFQGKDASQVMGNNDDTPLPEASQSSGEEGNSGGVSSPDGGELSSPNESGLPSTNEGGLSSPDEGGLPSPDEGVPPPPSEEWTPKDQIEYAQLQDDINEMDDEYMSNEDEEKIKRHRELGEKKRQAEIAEQRRKEQEEAEAQKRKEQEEAEAQAKKEKQRQETLDSWYNNPFKRPEGAPIEQNVFDLMKEDGGNLVNRFKDVKSGVGSYLGKGQEAQDNRERLKRNLKNSVGDKVRRTAIGAYKAAPKALYKAGRGTLKAAVGAGLGLTMAGIAIGGNTGDGEKTFATAAGALAMGASAGGSLFEGTIGKKMKDTSVRDAFGAGVYGNRTDARNARADKAYLQSSQFDDFYEKYYKGKQDQFGKAYNKKQIKEAVRSYRQAGITKESEIRRAMKLEEHYRKRDGISEVDARKQVQNIAQSFDDMNINNKAYSDKAMREAEISRIAGMLGNPKLENNKQMARQIFQGYVDWRNSAV